MRGGEMERLQLPGCDKSRIFWWNSLKVEVEVEGGETNPREKRRGRVFSWVTREK